MGKKGKKTKKQLEEELLRLQEEQVQQEEEERKRKEEEDARLAEEARIQAELDAKLFAEECARLEEEASKVASWCGEKSQNLAKEDAKINSAIEWNRFVACHKRPNAAYKNELNTYLATCREEEINKIAQVLERCNFSEEIVTDLIGEYCKARAKGNGEQQNLCMGFIDEIRQMEIDELDFATTHLVQHIEEQQVDARSEVRDTWGVADGDVRVGFWGTLQSKGFRAKTIDFAKIQICLELPKSIALQSMGHCIGVRALYTAYDNVSPPTCSCLTVGGVIRIDLLSIPPYPKKVKTWIIRSIPSTGRQFVRLPYPNPELASSASGALQPCKIEYTVSRNAIVAAEPQVSWWDAATEEWSTESITEVKWDAERRRISFFSLRLAAYAITQPSTLDFPFSFWMFQPMSGDTVKLQLRAARHEFVFTISAQGVTLEAPQLPQIEYLRKIMPPADLFMQLRLCGINLMPSPSDVALVQGVSPKDVGTESRAYSDLSEIAFTHDVTSSAQNASFDGTKAQVRIRLNPTFENRPVIETEEEVPPADADAPAPKKEGWRTVAFWCNKAAFMRATDDAPSDKIAEGLCTHATLWLCMQEAEAGVPSEIMAKVEPSLATARQVENVRQVLSLLRPLSVS